MAAVAACALVVATSPTEASQIPQYIATAKAIVAISVKDLPRVESVQAIRSRPLSPKIMAAIATAKRLDETRALDWRLRELYRAYLVRAADIFRLRSCTTADDVAREIRSWRMAAQCRLQMIDNIVLFAKSGHPTLELEELWENGFRRRIRREGALQRILDGSIVRSREATSESPRLVA